MTASVDDSCRLLGARYLRKQAKQLAGQLDGVRQGEEIEYVHRARVASRRIRAAMRMFRPCFDTKQFRFWRKEVRKLTKGLGPARDKDVQIAFLCNLMANLQDKAHYPGVARVLVRLEHRRDKLQSWAIRAVDRFEAKGVGEEIRKSAQRMIDKIQGDGATGHGESLYSLIEERTLVELDHCLALQDSLADSEDHARHHQMRIALKRLRYTLEISRQAPGMEQRLDDFVSLMKQAQTYLGDLHDCQVWVVQLEKILQKERRRTLTYYGHEGPLARLEVGINGLRRRRMEEHGQIFETLGFFWEKLRREDVWDRLKRVVRSRPEGVGVGVG